MRQNPHVRICGGPGSATTLVYPTVGRHLHRGPIHNNALEAEHPDAEIGSIRVSQRYLGAFRCFSWVI